MLLSQLKEAAGQKFLLCWATDDGMEFSVLTSVKALGASLQDLQDQGDLNFVQVDAFQGEITGMNHSSRGEVSFTATGSVRQIFSFVDGDVDQDELDLVSKFDLDGFAGE